MNSDADSIAAGLSSVNERIAAAIARSGRRAEDVRLLAVSKKVEAERIRSAVSAGQVLFGENYIQEAKQKIDGLSDTAAEFHFIGALQRNKARDAVGLFELIHTVDRSELADALSEVAARKSHSQDVLLQVNVSQEETKSGVEPEHAQQLAEHVIALPYLRLRGLMCIGKYFDSALPEEIRRSEFRAMAQLRKDLESRLGAELPELSMGMSHDFDLAIEEGATIVRVGTAIFGERG